MRSSLESPMSDPNYTHIILVLDRSGSMRRIRDDTIGAVNTLVDDQKKQPGECTMSLVQFDHEYQRVYSFKTLGEIEPRSESNYIPRGNTALLDAIGRAVADELEYIGKLEEDDRPGLVVLAVLTDGAENASKEYKRDEVRALLQTRQDAGWRVTYLSADSNAFADAPAYGVNRAAVLQFEAGSIQKAVGALSGSVVRCRSASARQEDVAAAAAYTEAELNAVKSWDTK